ncbi:hypothetical protein B0O80DRAFT_454190 [Mortierella sp. GBAus27b]|nr:hypothetical protein BGX31_006901 [Mortierella sp. GBA43]KAI8352295.1 hypothetical protein B0O80DRAFT_454190 [Mortierella sp. GBAus27b]
MHLSSSFLGASAALALMIVSTHGQEIAPPNAGDTMKVIYLDDLNQEIATDTAPFNDCFASEQAFAEYSYLNIVPNNATVNFYSDSNCQDFTFGLDGYYGGYPGPARSFRWVGWTLDYLGEFIVDQPIQGQGEAARKEEGAHTPADGSHPGYLPDNDTEPSTSKSSSSSSTFFGGVVGSMVVLSVGGVVFWKVAGKKLVEDKKGKGVLPYNRAGRDGDILLTTNERGHNSFELGDDDDDDDNGRQQHRSGRQERYRDDDHV